MTTQRTRRAFLGALGGGAVVAMAGCTGGNNAGSTATSTGGTTWGETTTETTTTSNPGSLLIFHAGSLSAPFDDAQNQFAAETGIDVSQESKGSVGSTKKITEAPHRKADVLAVADFRLIRDMVIPDFGTWYVVFATNAMTVAYTKDSKYADQFTRDNWWNVLSKNDVAVGHSDPAVDPNGYRSIMTMKLGAVPLDGETLYDEATAKAMIDNATVPASTESSMIAQLQAGKLDYAWEYQSTGASHDVETIDLQPAVDLSKVTTKYADHYGKVSVSAGGNTYTGAPIAYAMTVPSVAEDPENGAKWVEFMIGSEGQSILTKDGFQPVATPVVPSYAKDAVPETIMAKATAKDTLGPLQL